MIDDNDIYAGSRYQTLGAGRRKWLSELRSPRVRRERGEFIAEGNKSVAELMPLFECRLIVATHAWIERHENEIGAVELVQARRADMERISTLSNPPEVIALFAMPADSFDLQDLPGKLTVALDDIQDPGNLGTIIRACDWFGVNTIICSRNTVDVYNPKVIQSTMGSIGRVAVHYVDLADTLGQLSGMCEIYGTYLDGESVYDVKPAQTGVIVMGNEGHGISDEVSRVISSRISIPPFPAFAGHVESLNVSVATAITLAEFRRHH